MDFAWGKEPVWITLTSTISTNNWQTDIAGHATRLNFERFGQNLLDIDTRIVYVGIVNSHFKLMHSCFREGAKLHADSKTIHNFMTLAPKLTMNDLEKSKPTLGSISSVLVRFEKRVFVFNRLDGFVIIVGLDIEVPTPLPELIATHIKTAASMAPDLPLPVETVQVNSRREGSA